LKAEAYKLNEILKLAQLYYSNKDSGRALPSPGELGFFLAK